MKYADTNLLKTDLAACIDANIIKCAPFFFKI